MTQPQLSTEPLMPIPLRHDLSADARAHLRRDLLRRLESNLAHPDRDD